MLAQGTCRRSPRVMSCGCASSIYFHQLFDSFGSNVEQAERAWTCGEKRPWLWCSGHELPRSIRMFILYLRGNYAPGPGAGAVVIHSACTMQASVLR